MTMVHQHPANIARHDVLSWWARVPDRLTDFIGTMRFIVLSGVLIASWVTLNVVEALWDPSPFSILNLGFSAFSFFTAPLILMSQKRQSEHERVKAEHDYVVNEESLAWDRAIAAHLGVELPPGLSGGMVP